MSVELDMLKELVVSKLNGEEYSPNNHPACMYDAKKGGPVVAFSLMNIPKIAVAYVYMREGTILESHNHEPIEHLILYDGVIEVKTDKETLTVENGKAVSFYSHELHEITAVKDAWLIAVTIPRDKGFPGRGKEKRS